MKNPHFWISQDGIVTAAKDKSPRSVALTLQFRLRDRQEVAFAKKNLPAIQFSERSSLARIGIEIFAPKPPTFDGDKLILQTEAFLYDTSYPSAGYFKNLLRRGIPAGRLFFAPERDKLSSDEIWAALRENRIKLPNTISIDRFGRVFLTPHKVKYTLPPHLSADDLERVVQGFQARTFLDKVQIREDLDVVSISPNSGILTSCSMYLQEHYVVLNRGEGNFGLHSGAVLLDPIKTFGTNVMLEIYNTSDEVVVNPMVSIEVYRNSAPDVREYQALRDERLAHHADLDAVYRSLDTNPKIDEPKGKPKTGFSVSGQSARAENQSILLASTPNLKDNLRHNGGASLGGYRTVMQALSHGDRKADTLILDYFPNTFEHIEILTRISRLNLRRILFRKASRMSFFFLSSDAHSRLETYHQLGIEVCWFNEILKDLYVHTYKKNLGFFIRAEEVRRFQASTILAFYGSAYSMEDGQGRAVQDLVLKMTDFFGPNVGVLTGGGGGVMGLANEAAHEKRCLTGASFLELESQPPNVGVDFFNTFEENSRHNRQKWFMVADFCIFSMGGVGTLEETGIELCNLKLGIRPRVPTVFYHDSFWNELKNQFYTMIRTKRAPAWMADYVLFSGSADEIIEFYRKKLQIL